jgi:SAM-dependent methyltransferase
VSSFVASIPSIDEIHAYLARFNFFERYVHGAHEGDVYVSTHARRFRETLLHLPDLPPSPKVLELGAVPYSMTILLRRFCGAVVDTVSFYEVPSAAAARHVLESPDGRERYEFDYRSINVETDVFPFADAQYDLVLCCELLEHLLINPSHMFYEAHRVLKTGGSVLVSTPNVLRTANVTALIEGRNIYDAYHGNGIYGRHNREYTPAEVVQLLESCGFSITQTVTVDVYDPPAVPSKTGREDTIIAIGRATASRRIGTPPGLYVLLDEYTNVTRSAISMGVDEVGHLGRGWYDVEFEPEGGSRWMAAEGTIFLKRDRIATVGLTIQAHHPDITTKPVLVNVSAGDRNLGTVRLSDGAWHDVELAVPHDVAGSPLPIKISVSRTWRPSDVSGTSDTRELGIRVRRCWGR